MKVRLCRNVLILTSAAVCTNVEKCVEVCTNVQKCAQMYRSVQKCAQMFRSVQKCTDHEHLHNTMQYKSELITLDLFSTSNALVTAGLRSVVDYWHQWLISNWSQSTSIHCLFVFFHSSTTCRSGTNHLSTIPRSLTNLTERQPRISGKMSFDGQPLATRLPPDHQPPATSCRVYV